MEKHKLNVWGFDPTPKSLEYVSKRDQLKVDGLFHLTPEGLATFKGNLTFTKPNAARRDQVSMRVGKYSGMGGTISVPVNTLENWMERCGRKHLDILKMDVEGSEYEVLEDWIRRDFFPSINC
ncbi:methyltransferase domain-containing protein [Fragilaria crotonensis]|nr:methyltransferase domain-containing protein [Fragilaria crotonensis]